ncbi:MAG: hypothetical protein IKT27_04025 [Clostridia bacterium]|nr:hypothetical protein [Clostridia bacterium]
MLKITIHEKEQTPLNTEETCGKSNEGTSAARVFDTRKKDVMSRIETLHRLVSSFEPPTEDITNNTVSDMDYILESLDNVIKDIKDATGIED